MAKKAGFTPNKKGVIKGTKKKDKIVFNKSWKKAITVNALGGNDTIDFKKSKTKNNKLNGGDGNDIIYGGSNIDIIKGDKGNDKLYGNGGNDQIWGGIGNDIIEGGAGNDKLYGDAGNDTIRAGIGNDYVDGGVGNDFIYGQAGFNTLRGGAGADKIWGGTQNDTIYGGIDNDYVDGGSGNDFIFGEVGNDTLLGGVGNDTIKAGIGNDYVDGGVGDDALYGEAGLNTLKGGAGADKIYGGTGADSIYGGLGNDTISAGTGNNTIYFGANEGTDTVISNGGKDSLVFTGVESINDVSAVYGGKDLVITAGETNVVLKDYKDGGHSAYNAVVDNTSKLISKIAPKIIINEDADDVEVNGNAVDDEITYTGSNAIIRGGDGDDIINSHGEDTIYGDGGDDVINLFENVNKEIVINPNDGNDTITGVDNSLKTNIILDDFTGIYDSEQVENNLVLKLVTAENGEEIRQEVTIENYYSDVDVVNDAVAEKLNVNGELFNFSMVKEDGVVIITSPGNDTILGTDNSDLIYPGAGDDIIIGTKGNDNIYLESGNNTLLVNDNFLEATDHGGGWIEYNDSGVKTILMRDDATLTLDFVGENYSGIFCRGSGLDNNLYISLDGGLGYCIVVKDYFDAEGNPKVDKVSLKIGENTYTVPEWANGSYWGRTFDIQPFTEYSGEIYGTNMPYEEIRTAYGNHDDVVYARGGDDKIWAYGGHNVIYAGEGKKSVNMTGAQADNEIYLGSLNTTETTLYFGGVHSINSAIDNETGDLNVTYVQHAADTGDETYTSTARIDNWSGKTSNATISIRGDGRDNTLQALDGAQNFVDGGSSGNDTLIGGTGNDTFNFDYSNGYGIDTIRNYTSSDEIKFESGHSLLTVNFENFSYYRNNDSLVIKTVDSNNNDNYLIIEDYFTSENKINKIVANNYAAGTTDEMYLSDVDFTGIPDLNIEYANDSALIGGDGIDVLIGRTGANTITGGLSDDFLYTYGGVNTFEFNDGDGSDTLYQQGGENTILKFNNVGVNVLSSKTGYDKEDNDLLIHYDGESTLTVKDYYDTTKNIVTQIIDSSGNTFNMADYFKKVVYYSGGRYSTSDANDDVRVTYAPSIGYIQGKEGSDIIWGSANNDNLYTYKKGYNKFDTTVGVVDEIHGGAGDDLLVGQSSTNYLYGDEGDDSYIAYVNEGLNTYITDFSSTEGDSLNIYDGNYDHLHFVFNVSAGGDVDGYGLRILNDDNYDLWQADVEDVNIKGISVLGNWDVIEKYEEAGDANGCWHLTIADIDEVRTNIAGWLTAEGYDDVQDVFKNEKTEGDITTLTSMFDLTARWQYQAY